MNTKIGGKPRGLLVCLMVLSVTAAPASASVWATGESNDANSTLERAAVISTQENSEINTSSERIAFGAVRVGGSGATSSTETITVRNDGDSALSIDGITITGPDADAFEVVGNGLATLAPGEQRPIEVTFAPNATGELSATVNIEVSGSDRERVTIDLSGTGIAPDIEIRPETLRFVNLTGETATDTFTISNNGTAPLTVETVRIVGPDSPAFEHSVSGSFTIEPNRSRSVTVTFEQPELAPRFAMMHVMSDDPDEPQRNVWLTNTETVADVSPSTVLADRTIVNASVVNPQANASQTVNISWPLTRDDAVAIDSLALTLERSENFTINVTKSSERFEGTPPFELADGTEDVAFVSMNSTLADEDLRDVTVTFRVRKDQLNGTESDPEDVALYTRRNETWTELPTQLVDESPTHYFFEARSSSLTDFATGIKQAKFRIDDAVVSVTEIRTGESVDVLVRVTNVGGADGTYDVELFRESTLVERRELSIAPNGTRQTVFTESFEQPGTYDLYVNDRFVGNVTVNRERANASNIGETPFETAGNP